MSPVWRFLSVVLAVGSPLLSSCSDGILSPSQAQGVDWKLASFQKRDQSIVTPPDSSRFTLRLDQNSALHVRADCNVCGGSYTLSGDALSVGLLACTRAFCALTAPFDSEYATALQRSHSLEVRKDALTLRSSDGTLRFVR